MGVPFWGVLGVVFVLLSLPLLYSSSAGAFALGAGIAFLIVAVCNWILERTGATAAGPDPAPD